MTAPAFCAIERPVHRSRSATEIHADLVAGCRTLGQLSESWTETGHVPARDLAHVDRLLTGLHNLLIALRAGGDDA